MPVLGGLLADRYLGMRKAVIFGASLLVFGHFGMAYEGVQAVKIDGVISRDTQALQAFYFSLALIIVGVGFLKPNISTIVGKLYRKNDPRRDSGFTIFYAGINIGAWLAPLFCAYLGETYGWKYGFGLAGIGMIGGLLVFILGQKHLQGHAEPNFPERLHAKKAGISVEKWIYLGAFAAVFATWALIQTHSLLLSLGSYLPEVTPILLFLHTISLITIIGMSWFLFKYCNKVEREQMLALVVIILAGLLFFALYEQTYGSWVAFSDRVMDRHMFGIEWSAGQLTSMGAFFIIMLTPFFAWLWPALDKRNLNPSTPLKMAIGLLLAATAFLALSLGINATLENSLVSIWVLVAAYFILEIGEMVLSPISLSSVTQLSVKKVVSVMMGAWFLGTSYSEILAAELNKLSAIETEGGVVTDIAAALSTYDDLFIFSAKLGLAAALIFFMITPLMKKLMHGVK